MKKALSLICALFVAVAFAGVTLAAHHEGKEMKPTSKETSTDNTMKAPEKKEEAKPAEKK